MTIDGPRVIDEVLPAGDVRTLAVPGELLLTAADAASVVIRVDGAAIRPIGKAGESATLRLNRSNLRDLLPR